MRSVMEVMQLRQAEVFGKDVANELTVRRWFIKFRCDCDFGLQNEQCWQPESKVDDNQLKGVVEENPSETTRELASRFEVTIPTILCLVKAIGKVKKLDKWVPHELSERHQWNRFEACCSLVSRLKVDPFLHRIVMCDEKCILFNNYKLSAQWLDKNEVPKDTQMPSIHRKNLMVSVWWSSVDVKHYSFMKPGHSIMGDLYCEQLEEMMRQLQIKQPRLLNRDRPNLLQDNARPHIA
ncbi:histone-lysine N-methyltransferase SETMAR-like [Parasteatoda tepidariorum]|uniref:histone-lysine N-methyltransferase SETMAR-like n=1 Tax=Parasteatoda tepidariorum TaxID=114398 RepID=UPI0039BD687F